MTMVRYRSIAIGLVEIGLILTAFSAAMSPALAASVKSPNFLRKGAWVSAAKFGGSGNWPFSAKSNFRDISQLMPGRLALSPAKADSAGALSAPLAAFAGLPAGF